MNYAVVVAAGKSDRMGAKVDKAFLSLGPRPVLAHALMAFEKCADIDGIVVVARKDRVDAARNVADMFGISKVKQVVAGSALRQGSVLNGLNALPDDVRVVAIHDGARPMVTPQLIRECIKAAKRNGSGVAGVRITDTVKHVERGLTVTQTLDRSKLWAVQTPQVFKLELLRRALEHVIEKKLTVTDDAAAVEALGEKVRLVESTVLNLKITTPEDLALATNLLNLHWDSP